MPEQHPKDGEEFFQLNIRIPKILLKQLDEACFVLQTWEKGNKRWTRSRTTRYAIQELHKLLTDGAIVETPEITDSTGQPKPRKVASRQ